MDYVLLVVSGIVIGLIVAVPIGPVNLICIRRTLQFGPINGFISGLGAALGDGVFAVITGFGLTAAAQLIVGFSTILEMAGSVLLLFFGVRTFFAEPKPKLVQSYETKDMPALTIAHTVASTFALTITNPATLIGFTALFAGLGGLAGGDPSFLSAAVVVAGVFAGSTLWWLTLTTIVGLFHARIDDHVMRIINRASGAAVAAFGVAVLGHLALKLI